MGIGNQRCEMGWDRCGRPAVSKYPCCDLWACADHNHEDSNKFCGPGPTRGWRTKEMANENKSVSRDELALAIESTMICAAEDFALYRFVGVINDEIMFQDRNCAGYYTDVGFIVSGSDITIIDYYGSQESVYVYTRGEN